MPSPPPKTPRRIPPPSAGRSAPPTGTHTVPSPLSSPANVTPDAFTLQAQFDRLVEQVEQLQAQAQQAQKLAGIGTTAAMFAHEFNNLFTPVIAYAQYALESGDVAMMKKALGKVLERSAAVQQMSDRLVGLARQPDGAIRAVSVRAVAEDAVGCIGRDPEKDNISVNLRVDPELQVRANDNQLLQVLFNLVINARQAMLGRRGRLTIEAAPAPDGQVEIRVSDTGCGIPPDQLDRIFEPFFSTRRHADTPERRGLGLGLTVCRDIIEQLDGRISVTSRPGEGTTFTLLLPRAE